MNNIHFAFRELTSNLGSLDEYNEDAPTTLNALNQTDLIKEANTRLPNSEVGVID